MRAATGNAPAKLILTGEHAVVYDRPAVALPFPALAVTVTAEPASGPLSVVSDRPDLDVSGLIAAAEATLVHLGHPGEGLRLSLVSTIPPGAGLGSSAATAVAVVRAVAAACDATLTQRELLGLVDIAELHAHGKSSQLDANAVIAEGPVFFIRGQAPQPIAATFVPRLLVAHSGRTRDTKAAVVAFAAGLGDEPVKRAELLDSLGAASAAAAAALVAGDALALGAAMNAAHAQLACIGVSLPVLDELVAAARGAGALGAKLTGAGRGGCIVALAADATSERTIAAALRAAGAFAVYGESAP